MRKLIFLQLIRQPFVTGCIVFGALLLLTQAVSYQRYVLYKDARGRELSNAANVAKEKLQRALNSSRTATQTLSFIVTKYGAEKDFDSVAKEILAQEKYIDALELVEGGVITHVYPLQGNESAIGYNILEDTLRNKEALKAIEMKDLFFAGPFVLKQGGTSIVGRQPIFKEGKFWGFSVVLIHLSTLIKAAEIDTAHKSEYIFQLSKINPSTGKQEFFLPDATLFKNGDAVSAWVPDGDWKIDVLPKKSTVTVSSLPFSVLGFLFSFLGGIFAWFLAAQPYELEKSVKEKTISLIHERNLSESIVNSLPGVFYMADVNGMLVRWNKNFETVTGYAPEELSQMRILNFVPLEEQQKLLKQKQVAMDKGTSETETFFLTKERKTIPYFFTASLTIYNHQPCLLGIGIDITERRKSEEEIKQSQHELRELSAHLQNIRENERTNIAREIHDELGQQLTGLKMDASWLLKKIDSNDTLLQQKGMTMISLIDETVKTVRRISSELRPGILDDLGLIAALEWQCSDFQSRTGISCSFRTSIAELEIEKETATGVFRVYQETLTNVTRHANATEVKSSLEKANNQLTLTIVDNGKGFDTTETKNGKTLGLIGMKERAAMMKGELNIDSEKGKGTKIILTVPCK